jgi:hypothetical protein
LKRRMRLSEWRAIVRLNNRFLAVEGGDIVARKQRIAVVALAPARFQEAHNFYYPPRAKSYTNIERSITVPLVPLAGAPRDEALSRS